MSDKDESKDVPEFVAVTPRGAVPDQPETQPEPAAAEAEPAVDAEPETAAGVEQPTEPDAPAGSAQPDTAPATAAESASEPVAGAEPAPDTADAPDDEPAADTEPAPAPTLQWTAPVLERPASLTRGAEPEPEATTDGDVEVSVRVAAEGMAAALAGHSAADAEDDAAGRTIGPLAIVTAVCVVLALAAGALLAVTAHSNSEHRAVAEARVGALDAAKRETAVALTYDYRTLDADFQRAEAGMSRGFRANYAQTVAQSVAPLAQKTHAITTGTIAAAGVISASATTARILVFANQTVENKLLNATSRLDRSVIEVSMLKENGRWVIDKLQPS
jgi:hypothetical protein